MSTQETPTLIEAFKMNGLVQFAIVSYILGRLNDTLNVGEITFGFVLVLHYTYGNMIYFFFPAELITPKSSPVPWLIFPTSVNWDSGNVTWMLSVWMAVTWKYSIEQLSSILVGCLHACFFLKVLNEDIHVGTTLMVIPYKDAKYIHMNIPGFVMFPPFVVPPNIFILLCDTIASVALTFGGKMFTINPRDLVREIVFTDPDGTRYCMSGIGSGSIDKSGTVWLVSVTTLFYAFDLLYFLLSRSAIRS